MGKYQDEDTDEHLSGRSAHKDRYPDKRTEVNFEGDSHEAYLHQLIDKAVRSRPYRLSEQEQDVAPPAAPVIAEAPALPAKPVDVEPVIAAPKRAARLQSWGLAHLEDPMLQKKNAFYPNTLAEFHEGGDDSLQQHLEGVTGTDAQMLIHGDALYDADNIQLPSAPIQQRQFIRQCLQKAKQFKFGDHFGENTGAFLHCLNQALCSRAMQEAMHHTEQFAEWFPDILKDIVLDVAVDTNRYEDGSTVHGFMLDTQNKQWPSLRNYTADTLDHYAKECIAELWHAPITTPGERYKHDPRSEKNAWRERISQQNELDAHSAEPMVRDHIADTLDAYTHAFAMERAQFPSLDKNPPDPQYQGDAWQEKISQMACKPGSVPIAGR